MKIFQKKSLTLAMASLLAGSAIFTAMTPQPVSAANNTLSTVSAVEMAMVDDKMVKVQYFDLTVNVDWDYDSALPDTDIITDAAVLKKIQLGTGRNRGGTGESARKEVVLDRKYVTDLINQTARTLFIMTNGQHRLRNVYVFKNSKFGQNVDIRVINTPGRANAAAAGWLTAGGFTTNNYITNCTLGGEQADGVCGTAPSADGLDPENFVQTGEVIAHELGHYLYALYDEYREAGKACEPQAAPVAPCDTDQPRPTAMNNQAAAYRLSIPQDYTGMLDNKPVMLINTAHGRVYGQSAWETLIASPANDTAVAKETHGERRIRFEAFNGIAVPALAELKQFVEGTFENTAEGVIANRDDRLKRQTTGGTEVAKFAGYDTKLKVVFEGEAPGQDATPAPAMPRNVLIIDRTVPGATFTQIKTAAQGLIDRAPANSRFAVVAIPAVEGAGSFVSFADNGGIGVKTTLKNSINALEPADEDVDVQAAYNAASALVTAARPTAPATENAANTDTLTLMTLNTTEVPANLGETARAAKIAFNVIGFRAPVTLSRPVATPVPAKSLQNLAVASGGSNNTVSNANDAIKKGGAALAEAMGESEALITSDITDDVFAKGATLETSFKMNAQVDGNVVVRWFYDIEDKAKLTFSGCTPSFTVLSDDEEKAECTFNTDGTKTVAVAVKSDAMSDASAVEVEVVSMPNGTPVELNAMIDGGTVETNRAPVLMVKFANSTPIIKALIDVEIYNIDSTSETPVFKRTLTSANDSGNNGDNTPDDGVYTVDLSGLLPAGSYFVVANATTDAGSKFSSKRVINAVTGNTAAESNVGAPIQRTAEGEFDLETGARGLATPAAGGKSSGGCTVGNGSDVGLLALLSLAFMGLMRRRFGARRNRAA